MSTTSTVAAASIPRDEAGRQDLLPDRTALPRVVIGAVSLTALVVGVVGLAASLPAARGAGLLIFTLLGVGSAPWQLVKRMLLAERLTLTGVTGVAVLTLPSVAMVSLDSWHPAIVFVPIAIIATALHIAGVTTAVRDRRATRTAAVPPARPGTDAGDPAAVDGAPAGAGRLRRAAGGGWEIPLAVLGTALCLGSALTHRHLAPGAWGFLPRIGPVWFVGLVLVLVAIVTARPWPERRMAVPVVLLVEVLTLTPALVYVGPRSQSTTKHIELLELVQAGHGLHSSVPAYNSWPGFFSSTAWLTDIAGIAHPMTLALFWPPLLALLRVAALRYLFGQLLATPFQRWGAVTLAVLVDSIGADYFSPQSVGFVLGLAAFGLALAPERTRLHQGMLLVVGLTVAVTHQLSPFLIGGVLVLLALFRQVKPWWVPLLVLGPAVAWTLVHLSSVSGFLSLGTLGRASNFRPPETVAQTGLERLPIITETTGALVGGMFLVGVLGLVTLLRHRRSARVWAMALAPTVGLALVAVNPYGQEGVFRAALFALPWLAALAASSLPWRPPMIRRWPFVGLTAVLAVTFLVASFALDSFTVTRPADVAAVRYPSEHGAGDYLITFLGQGDLPTTVLPGEIVTSPDELAAPDGSGVGQAEPMDELPPATEVARIDELLWQRYLADWQGPRPPTYALWSPVQSTYMRDYGLQRPERFAALRDELYRSPFWHPVLRQDGTVLFQFDVGRYSAGRS